MPTLSILLPTWNGARYLDAQVESILAQSEGDFELIAIDDGSSDETPRLLADYAARDSRVRVVVSDGNRGQVARIDELLGHATGQYVGIADQDDVWDRDRNARLLARIGDRAMAFGTSRLIDGEGRDLGRTLLDAVAADGDSSGRLKALFRPMVSAHGMIVRRDWLGSSTGGVLMFDEGLALEAIWGAGLVFVPDAVVHHRIHGGNQANGGAATAGQRVGLARQVARSTGFQPAARLHLHMALLHLSRALRIDAAVRRMAGKLATATFESWYAQDRPRGPVDHALRRMLEAALRPHAGSADDWRYCEERLDIVTRTIAHPSNLKQAYWQLRSALRGA